MTRIYISLPITGKTWEQACSDAAAIEQRLLEIATDCGEQVHIINPMHLAEMTRTAHGEDFKHYSERQQLALFLATDVQTILDTADCIYFDRHDVALKSCPSKGMRLEYQLAQIYGIPCFGKGWAGEGFNLPKAFLK